MRKSKRCEREAKLISGGRLDTTLIIHTWNCCDEFDKEKGEKMLLSEGIKRANDGRIGTGATCRSSSDQRSSSNANLLWSGVSKLMKIAVAPE